MSHALTIVVAAGMSGPTRAYGRGGIGGVVAEAAFLSGSGAHELATTRHATVRIREGTPPVECVQTASIGIDEPNDS
jgi:hypothetical protein